jgi:transcriptional regulator with XRE-family HTH domain
MPVEAPVEEKFQEQKIKPFSANRIALVIEEKAQGKHGPRQRSALRAAIANALGTTLTKVSRMLNQTDQPTTPELATIAQVLGVTTDQLIKLEE